MKKIIIIVLLAVVAVAGVYYGHKAWKKYQHQRKWSMILEKPFIDFEVETPDSTIHHLSDYAGKGEYVLLDFWASWCGGCIGSFPMMKELHEKYSDCGLRLIGVSVDNNIEAWHYALGKHDLPWLQLRETTESKLSHTSASDIYEIYGIPNFILIDPTGKVIFLPYEDHHFLDDIHEDIRVKLKEVFGK